MQHEYYNITRGGRIIIINSIYNYKLMLYTLIGMLQTNGFSNDRSIKSITAIHN
jgi:hypothetical protein